VTPSPPALLAEAREEEYVDTRVAIVMASALFASWHPARRAMRVDPVRLLREE
jgi:ABC-type lipoprotein release transport system permease subunit